MPTVDFTYDQAKSGLFGVFIASSASNPQYLRAPQIGNTTPEGLWAGWLTGTDATMRTTGTNQFMVMVDGKKATTNSAVAGVVTIFAGLPDEPHFVQINGKTESFSAFIGPLTDGTPIFFSVTGAAPAIRGFHDDSETWLLGDTAFPGFMNGVRSPAWGQPWRQLAMYERQVIVRNNANEYFTVPSTFTNDVPMFSDADSTGPAGALAAAGQCIPGSGDDIWAPTSTPVGPTTFFSSAYLSAAQPTEGQIQRVNRGSPANFGGGSGYIAQFKGRGTELWACFNSWSVSDNPVLGVQFTRVTAGSAATVTIARASTAPSSTTASNLPPGMTFNGNVTISGTPTTPGDYLVPITMTVASSTDTNRGWQLIRVDPVAGAPAIYNRPGFQAEVGTASALGIIASNSPTSYAASGLPTGLSINTSTGEISGTPTTPGTGTATISATNGTGTGTVNLHWIVYAAGAPKWLDLETQAAGPAHIHVPLWYSLVTGFRFQVRASNSPTSFSATGLPNGLTIDPVTGWITGTPTQFGPFAATVTATNAAGSSSATLLISTQSVNTAAGHMRSVSERLDVRYAIDNTEFNTVQCLPSGLKLSPGGYNGSRETVAATGGGNMTTWVRLAYGLDPNVDHVYTVLCKSVVFGVAMRNPTGGPKSISEVNKNRINCIFLGDSTMAASANGISEAHTLTARLGINGLNLAKGGDAMQDILRRLPRVVTVAAGTANPKFDVAITMSSSNDQARPGSPWQANTAYALTAAVYYDGRSYVCTQAGTTGNTPPTVIRMAKNVITDGSVVWSSIGLSSNVNYNISGGQESIWVAGDYQYNKIFVKNGGRIYQLDTVGTSVTGPTGTNTTLNGISDGGTARWHCVSESANWTAGSYNVGDIVNNNGELYQCITAGTSVSPGPLGRFRSTAGTVGFSDGGTARWNCVSERTIGSNGDYYCRIWMPSRKYRKYDVMQNGDSYYSCDSGGISGNTPPTGSSTTPGSISDGVCTWHRVGWTSVEQTTLMLQATLDYCQRVIVRPRATPGVLGSVNTQFTRDGVNAVASKRAIYVSEFLETLTSYPQWLKWRPTPDGSHLSDWGSDQLLLLALRDYAQPVVGVPAIGFVW